MSLGHAVMGLLWVRAMTGYDLKTRWFDRSMRYFWPTDQAQIYRTLDILAGRGWVSYEIEPAEDRPNRKVYTLPRPARRNSGDGSPSRNPCRRSATPRWPRSSAATRSTRGSRSPSCVASGTNPLPG